MKYIITHKDFDLPLFTKEGYTVICPKGVTVTNWKNVEYFDNGLDNRMWSEIAAMKWIADNSTEDWIQINHYRRILDEFPCHCCMAEPMVFQNMNLAQHYSLYHNIDDLSICSGIIKELYPDLYNIWIQTLNSNVFIPYNMVQLPKDCFKDYMTKMYTILSKILELYLIGNYEDMLKYIESKPVYSENNNARNTDPVYQARLIAFLSERITTWYMNCLTASNAVLYPCRVTKYENAF